MSNLKEKDVMAADKYKAEVHEMFENLAIETRKQLLDKIKVPGLDKNIDNDLDKLIANLKKTNFEAYLKVFLKNQFIQSGEASVPSNNEKEVYEVYSQFNNMECPRDTAVQVMINGQKKYLHANAVTMRDLTHILVQFPHQPETRETFWKLVFDGCNLIVDLTNTDDNIGGTYPDKYDMPWLFGSMSVALIQKDDTNDNQKITTYSYEVKDSTTEKTKKITRLNYYGWNESSKTLCTELDTLVNLVNQKISKIDSKLIVHGGNGDGRPGTFSTARVLSYLIENGKVDENNWIKLIKDMILSGREQRGHSFVQKEEQLDTLLEFGRNVFKKVQKLKIPMGIKAAIEAAEELVQTATVIAEKLVLVAEKAAEELLLNTEKSKGGIKTTTAEAAELSLIAETAAEKLTLIAKKAAEELALIAKTVAEKLAQSEATETARAATAVAVAATTTAVAAAAAEELALTAIAAAEELSQITARGRYSEGKAAAVAAEAEAAAEVTAEIVAATAVAAALAATEATDAAAKAEIAATIATSRAAIASAAAAAHAAAVAHAAAARAAAKE